MLMGRCGRVPQLLASLWHMAEKFDILSEDPWTMGDEANY
jgi:hypothetical protein